MTNEVAKKIIRGITDKIECNTVDIDDWAEFWGFTREEYEEFLDMAIKALKTQPTRVDETYLSIKDAIGELKAQREHIVGYMSVVGTTAYDMAVEALEAQPSEDCISRQAVLDVINFEDEWLFDAKSYNADTKIAFSAIKSKISELPSVTPRRDLAETSQDCISREEAINEANNLSLETSYDNEKVERMLRDLPSVTLERPTGKWIEIEIDAGEFIYKCTKCGMRVINPYKYCPNCGAEMGGGEDEVSD